MNILSFSGNVPRNRGLRAVAYIAILVCCLNGCGGTAKKTPNTKTPTKDGRADKPIDPEPSAVAASKSGTVPDDSAAIKPANSPSKDESDPSDPTNSGRVAENSEGAPTEQVDAEPVPADVAKADESQVAPEEKTEPERLLLFSGSGPLVVDLHITLDGLSLTAATDRLIDDVLELANSNSDAETTWKELTTHRSFTYGQFGNPRVESEQQRQELVTSYDINRNGRVDRSEVLGFLRQNAADSKRFSLQRTNTGNQTPPQSGLLKWLDVDQDELLDRNEIANAAERLWLNDAQDDKLLVSTDFQTTQASMARPMRSRYRPKRRGVLITEFTNWSKLLYEMEEHYSYGNPITPADIPGFETFFLRLDVDQDEMISVREFSKVAEIAPHVIVEMKFSRDQPPVASTEVIETDIDFQYVQSAQQTVSLTIANSPVQISLQDNFAGNTYDDQASQLLAAIDKNKDGYLSQEEYTQSGNPGLIPFEAVDVNEDGKAFPKEIAAALEQTQMATAYRIASSIGQQNDSVFEFLDTDKNGRLTTREVRAAPNRLTEANLNGDEYVSREEFPISLSIAINRGGANRNNFVAQRPRMQTPNTTGTGDWFTSMDTNRDGELSQSEFLGPASIFEQLDADRDGFVDADERERKP